MFFSPVVVKTQVWGLFPPRKREIRGNELSCGSWNERTVTSTEASAVSMEAQTCPQRVPSPLCPAPVPGSSMFSVSVWRLKGSVEELSRCLRMMDLSMMVPEGSLTGSVIRVSIRGSEGTRLCSSRGGNSCKFYLPINPQCRNNAQGPQYSAEVTENG